MADKSSLSNKEKDISPEELVKEKSALYLERFEKHAFVLGEPCVDAQQYEAVITRLNNMIEKGLSYTEYRAGFGSANIEMLLGVLEQYGKDGCNTGAFAYRTALSTLHTYVEKNKEHGLEDLQLQERLDALEGEPNQLGGSLSFTPLSAAEVQSLDYKQFAANRHSMRHFSGTPVEIPVLERAIALAQHTPSASNKQGWRCLIISDKAVLSEVLKNQNGNEGFGHEFDKLLVVLADLRYYYRDKELFQAYVDGGMYAQSILNALHYEHVATVPLNACLQKEQEENVRNILKLDDAEILILFIGVGNYPEVCQTARSERRPVHEVQVI